MRFRAFDDIVFSQHRRPLVHLGTQPIAVGSAEALWPEAESYLLSASDVLLQFRRLRRNRPEGLGGRRGLTSQNSCRRYMWLERYQK